MTVNNFGQVSAPVARVYRGAQPTDAQFKELKDIGITTVLDLREDIGRGEEAAVCSALGLHHVNIPIGNQHLPVIGLLGVLPPTKDQALQCLRYLEDPDTICFVHCRHGEDRTGAVIAMYRMLVDKWTNVEAMAEAKQYHLNPLQILIREYIEDFKPSDLKQ